MTGREMILYILENHLEDDDIFANGCPVGFTPVNKAAVKLGVGEAILTSWIQTGQIEAVKIAGRYFVPDKILLNGFRKGVKTRVKSTEEDDI